jgi:hypothetical protein
MNKILFLLFLIFFSFYNYSQTPTLYEQKKIELIKETIKTILIINGAWDSSTELELKYNNDIERLSWLMDLGFLGKTEVEKEYYRKLALLDKYKSKKEIQDDLLALKNEKIQLERQKLNQTDYFSILNYIKKNYDSWATKKSDFEKKSEYEDRITSQSDSVLKSIARDYIASKLERFTKAQYNSTFAPIIKSVYDAENEKFDLNITLRDINWNESLFVPRNIVQESGNKNCSWKTYEINFEDFCFYNNEIYPTSIKFNFYNFDETLKTKLPIKCDKGFIFTFRELSDSIHFPKLLSYKFDYFDIKRTEDSIIRSTIDSLNQILFANIFNTSKDSIQFESKDFSTSLSNKRLHYYKQFENMKLDLNSGKHLTDQQYVNIYFSYYPEKRNEAEKSYLYYKCFSEYSIDTISFYKDFILSKFNLFKLEQSDCFNSALNLKIDPYTSLRQLKYLILGEFGLGYDCSNLFVDINEAKKKFEVGDEVLKKEIAIRLLKSLINDRFYADRKFYYREGYWDLYIRDLFKELNFLFKGSGYEVSLYELIIYNNKELNKIWHKKKKKYRDLEQFVSSIINGKSPFPFKEIFYQTN